MAERSLLSPKKIPEATRGRKGTEFRQFGSDCDRSRGGGRRRTGSSKCSGRKKRSVLGQDKITPRGLGSSGHWLQKCAAIDPSHWLTRCFHYPIISGSPRELPARDLICIVRCPATNFPTPRHLPNPSSRRSIGSGPEQYLPGARPLPARSPRPTG